MHRKTCPLCQNNNSHEVFKSDHRVVVECNKCKFLYASKFNEDELARLYKTYYYASKDDPRIQEWIDQNMHIWQQLAKELQKILPAKCRLLDIGAGTGGFLLAIRELMPEISLNAIESSIEAVKSIKKRMPFVDISEKSLESTDIKNSSKYEIITMLQCLEHVYDPLDYLKIAHSLLDDDGYLLVTVPNRHTYKAFFQKYKEPLCFGNPTHLQFFSQSSMKAALYKSGFSTVKRLANFGGTNLNGIMTIIQYLFRLFGISSELRFIAKK